MATDYIALGLADTGEADVNDAFANMSAQTNDTFPETMVTYINIANRTSFAVSAEVALRVKDAIAGEYIPEWVDDALKTVGIDVNNAETLGMLSVIGVSGPSIAALTEMGKVVVPVYPNLKVGQLATARQRRLDAEAVEAAAQV